MHQYLLCIPIPDISPADTGTFATDTDSIGASLIPMIETI